ncbi:MAG: C40 family peptidase [Clostridia bacterium]|nr:C40 family peptidase [Clostridia bacterium]
MKKRVFSIALCILLTLAFFAHSAAESDLIGDANGDGEVTVSDAALAMRLSVGLDWRMNLRARFNCDFNGNGEIDASDASQILRHAAGLKQLVMPTTDAVLLEELNANSHYIELFTEWIARYIQSLPTQNPYRKVLYEAAKYIGTPYEEMDCSKFVRTAYRDAGISTSVYPQTNSNGTLVWYQSNRPERLHEMPMIEELEFDIDVLNPGYVLIYINPETGMGNHLALYVGKIDGEPVIMDSGNDGVRLQGLWSGGSWELTYYVDPLG